MFENHCEIWQSQYRNKKIILDKEEQELDKPEENSKFLPFLNSFLADILIFPVALITLIITLIIIIYDILDKLS